MASSIKAWYNGKQVYLSVPDNALVFDGFQFKPVSALKYICLAEIHSTDVTATVPPKWPVTETINQQQLTWKNLWHCCVIDYQNNPVLDPPADVVYITDPNDGNCICGITCMGTDLQYVMVTNDDSIQP